jgi:hypothetical protein
MAINTTPAYPLPGDEITLSRTGGQGNVTEFEILSVPVGSKVPLGRLVSLRKEPIATFKPDVQGAYGIRGYEYRDIYLPEDAGGPSDGSAMRRLMGFQDGTVYVTAALDLPIQTVLGHHAVLRLYVHNATVRGAQFHKPSTDQAKVAIQQSTVVAAVAALVGVTASMGSLMEDFVSDVRALGEKYDTHIKIAGGVHNSADTTNVAKRQPAYSVPAALDQLMELADVMLEHMRPRSGPGAWHNADDTKNLPISHRSPIFPNALVALAEIRELYEKHRVQIASPNSHDGPDNGVGSTMPAPLPLTACIVAFLDAVASQSLSVPTGVQPGVVNLSTVGFKLAG